MAKQPQPKQTGLDEGPELPGPDETQTERMTPPQYRDAGLHGPEGTNQRHEAALGRQQTFGEKAVGLSFNPSGDPVVNQLKHLDRKSVV